jgi:hypothetical protein
MVQQVLPFLKGTPVLVMRAGHWPNRADVLSVQSMYPKHTVFEEHIHTPKGVRFALTVRRWK